MKFKVLNRKQQQFQGFFTISFALRGKLCSDPPPFHRSNFWGEGNFSQNITYVVSAMRVVGCNLQVTRELLRISVISRPLSGTRANAPSLLLVLLHFAIPSSPCAFGIGSCKSKFTVNEQYLHSSSIIILTKHQYQAQAQPGCTSRPADGLRSGWVEAVVRDSVSLHKLSVLAQLR